MLTGGGMTCPRCHCPIPGNKLVCPGCIEADGRKGTIELQFSHMEKVLSEELPLNLCNPGKGKVHIVLFGSGDRAWCWSKLPGVQRTRFPAPYRTADRRVTCIDCRRELSALVTRYRREKGLV